MGNLSILSTSAALSSQQEVQQNQQSVELQQNNNLTIWDDTPKGKNGKVQNATPTIGFGHATFKTEATPELKLYRDTSKRYSLNITKLSKQTGFSKALISDIVANESLTNVGTYSQITNTCEIGFGHTNKAKHNNNYKAGDKISTEEAFQILGQDMIDTKNELRKIPELNFDKLPKSIQEGLISLAFNRGVGKLDPKNKAFDKNYQKLFDAIKKKDYASVATGMLQQPQTMPAKARTGLMERNIYRLLISIRDLPKSQQKKVIDELTKSKYYTSTIDSLESNLKIKASKDLQETIRKYRQALNNPQPIYT